MRIVARLYLPSVEEMIKNCGLNENGKVQQYIDNFVLRESEPYIPFKTGILRDSGSIASGGGQVIWNTPYAHYMYEGKLMVSPTTGSSWAKKGEQKVYAEPAKTLNYQSDDNRKDRWFDRMIVNKKEELIKGCQNIVNGGN